MSSILTVFGTLALLAGIYIAATSIRSDIQVGIAATCLIGGLLMIGLGSALWQLHAIKRELRRKRQSSS